MVLSFVDMRSGGDTMIPMEVCYEQEGDMRIVEVDSDDEKVKSLFIDDFLQNNRLDNVTQLMGFHPDYLDIYLKTTHYLLREDGPLPFEYRHYIAIMAAGRHQCTYLMSLHAHEFLLCGGDANWLKGLDHIPKKLKDLYEINKILAHRPWNITKAHIAALARGADNWSMSELMHGIILLAHFHALSSFVFGCGINKEIDHPGGHSWLAKLTGNDTNANDLFDNASSSPEESIMNFEEDVSVEVLMERMRQLHEEQSEEASQEELAKRFEKVEIQSLELTVGKKKPAPQSGINRFIRDPEYAYIDFAQRESHAEVPTFRVQDYCWEDHGFSLANRLYTDIGNLLDEKFNTAYNLTYYTMGHNTEVDTSSFRLAIWNYIHCMYGIRHDDYDYGAINHLLERNLKAYIKTATCYPERLTKKDYDGVMREFKHSEKVHVNLMLLEARMQAELLYALRAIMRFMT